MKYAILNLLLGAALLLYGALVPALLIPAMWLGISFAALGIAYLLRRPSLLGKRPDGSMALWSLLAFMPLHLLLQTIWQVARLCSRERPWDRICAHLVAGRRPLAHEMPEEVALVIDLTSEFAEPAAVREGRDYRLFPILDASVPEIGALRAFIATLPDARAYVHCAQGHGRTGLFCIAYLVERKLCGSSVEAKRMLQAARPGIQLNRVQREFVQAHYG